MVRRPVLTGGIAGVAVLFAFVATNALYRQPGRHPMPMMATRGTAEAASAGGEAVNESGLMPVPLVLEVQTALARTGHYTSALDGRPGRATTAAIRAFQAENALRVDGEPSPLLLSQIRQLIAEAPSPSARPEAARYASIDDRMGEGATGGGAPAGPAPDAAATGSIAGLPEKELVRRIQSGLSNAEVAKLKADGILGEQTREAIRTFEALEGLDVTGAPDARILKRLIEIGAAQ